MRAVLIFPILAKAPDRAYDCINGNSSLQTHAQGGEIVTKDSCRDLSTTGTFGKVNGTVCDCVVPGKKLGTPVHNPPEHR